ncbi:hypothetical protein LQZ18_02455 [Lachnospiraceae bacterium ZAX-1]
MTKIGKLYEEERQESMNQREQETRQKERVEFAGKLLSDNVETIQIMKYAGLTREQIESVKKEMLAAVN